MKKCQSSFQVNTLFVEASLQSCSGAIQDTLYRNKQKHTTANMLLAEGKLCNVIRCLLNRCSKLADANEW